MLAVLVLLGSRHAHAADVDLFVPALSLSRLHGTLQGEAPTVRSGGLSFGLVGAWIDDPVVQGEDAAVSRLVPLHAQGTLDFGERFRVDASVPFYTSVRAPLQDFAGTAPGDVQLGGLWAIAGEEGGPIAVGLLPRLTLGTGNQDALVSAGWTGGATLAVGGDVGRVGWVANGGVTVGQDSPLLGDTGGAGIGAHTVAGAWIALVGGVRAGAEVDARFGGVSGNARDGQRSVNAQGFVQAASSQGLGALLGFGTGLVSDVGTARFRLFGALSWTAWRSDRDDDTLADRVDACPDQPEDADGFQDEDGCPDRDNDGDAIADVDDQCPDAAEDVDAWVDDDGCPELDNDEDGLVDTADECPDAPGIEAHGGCPDVDGDGLRDLDDTCPAAAGSVDQDGCPDTDADGLHDGIDACPEAARPDDETAATTDGCPRPVYVSAQAIVTPRMPFAEGKNAIGEEARETLNAVAAKMLAHRDLGRVEVQGHTDNVGPNSYNKKLSLRRANAVRDYLVARGVPADRLVARGYGESRPQFTNRTAGGRTKNRRVQFVLLDPPAPRPDPTDASSSP